MLYIININTYVIYKLYINNEISDKGRFPRKFQIDYYREDIK